MRPIFGVTSLFVSFVALMMVLSLSAGPQRCFQTHSWLPHHQFFAHHPQVEQHKQRHQLRGVLLQSPAAHLDMLKLTFDNPKQVFDLGAHADFELLGHDINSVCLISARRSPKHMTVCHFVHIIVSRRLSAP